MLIRRARFASVRSHTNNLVRICSGCGAWHACTHSSACTACGSSSLQSEDAVKKPERDFSELVALGDKQDARLYSCFDFAVTKYPWPASERLHLTTVMNGVSSLKQLRKASLPILEKMHKRTNDCAVKLVGANEASKAHVGFFKHSPLRLTCMHYLAIPLRQDLVVSSNWLPLAQVLTDIEANDRILKEHLDGD